MQLSGILLKFMPGLLNLITSSWHLRVFQVILPKIFRIEEIIDKNISELQHKPMLVDLTVEEGTRLKVLYGSQSGFHAVDLDSARFG